MRKTWLVIGLAALVAGTAWADDSRSLEGRAPAAGIDKVLLDVGVGDVEVVGNAGIDEVVVSVDLEPRRGGFFSSMKKARREVEEAELRMDAAKGVFRIEIETDRDNRHFEEDWTIELPSRLAIAIDLGVGDIVVENLAGTLTVDVGVGDVEAEAVSGDVFIDLGVGDATVQAAAENYGAVNGSGGVGDARLTVRGQRIASSGLVGHSAEWTGAGDHTIEISIGVGDARVTLE